MVREFKLINELGQEFSLMDIYNFALLTGPDGLGISYSTDYARIGNSFIESLRVMDQKQITGQINFINYDNYTSFVNFIETASKLRLAYKIPYNNYTREFLRDVNIREITKTQKQENAIISETVIFDCLSLWYEEQEVVYTIDPVSNELRWDFRWNPVFTAYDNRNIVFDNQGHTEASFKLELDGEVVDPKITILEDGVEAKVLDLEGLTIQTGSKFVYNTKETEQEICLVTSGVKTNLFEMLNPNFINFMTLRKGVSTIRLEADAEITSGKLTIYVQYKAV